MPKRIENATPDAERCVTSYPHAEIEALVDALDFERAVIDHPFSPFVDLSVEQMQALVQAGITMNFTYDEISPLLGVDSKRIYDAIRAIGVEHVMRLIRGYMKAFGLGGAEADAVCCDNPAKVLGVVHETARG